MISKWFFFFVYIGKRENTPLFCGKKYRLKDLWNLFCDCTTNTVTGLMIFFLSTCLVKERAEHLGRALGVSGPILRSLGGILWSFYVLANVWSVLNWELELELGPFLATGPNIVQKLTSFDLSSHLVQVSTWAKVPQTRERKCLLTRWQRACIHKDFSSSLPLEWAIQFRGEMTAWGHQHKIHGSARVLIRWWWYDSIICWGLSPQPHNSPANELNMSNFQPRV